MSFGVIGHTGTDPCKYLRQLSAGRLTRRIISILIILSCVQFFGPSTTRADSNPARVSIIGVDSSSFPEIKLDLTVLDGAGLPIAGLEKDRFEALEDGKAVSISQVETLQSGDAAIGVVLGVDASGSMSGQTLDDTKRAINGFADRLPSGAKISAVRFGGAFCSVEAGPDLTTDRASINAFINSTQAVGDTPLHDATLSAIQKSLSAPQGRRIVVMVTDGDDTCSKASADTVIASALKNSVPLYFIGLGSELKPTVLQNMASATGGLYLAAADSSKLSSVYEELSARIRTRYTVRIQSALFADNREHSLIIRVKGAASDVVSETRYTPPIIKPDLRLNISDGERISGPTALRVSTASPVKIARVDYLLNDVLLGTVDREPFEQTLAPTSLAQTIRTLRVRATDTGGSTTEKAINVTLVPPTVKLSLSDGQSLAGLTSLTISTEPEITLSSAEVFLDGARLGSSEGDAPSFTIDPQGLSTGNHALRVVATDSAENKAEKTINVQLDSTGLFGVIPFWGLLGVALALPVVLLPLVGRARRPKSRCVRCGKPLLKTWASCPYCGNGEPVAPEPNRSPTNGRGEARQPGNQPATLPSASGLTVALQAKSEKPPTAFLVVTNGAEPGRSYPLASALLTIGRDPTNSIVISDDKAASFHASIRHTDGASLLANLDPGNKTLVNGDRIEIKQLQTGDQITIGQTTFALVTTTRQNKKLSTDQQE